MATCETWQAPYVSSGFQGPSASAACNAVANYYGTFDPAVSYSGNVSGSVCFVISNVDQSELTQSGIENICTPVTPQPSGNTINCEGACTVGIELKPDVPDAERIGDMSMLWGAFLVVLVAVYCAKQLLKFFESSPHGEN